MKILLQVPLNPYSGYGLDGIGMARAFMKMGADVHIAPVSVGTPLPPDIAALLVKEAQPPFDLFIHHVDPMLLDATAARRAAKVTVAWTMWEYSSFENLPKELDSMGKRLAGFDALVAYDEPTRQCFEPYVAENQKLIKLQGGYDPSNWGYIERDWDSPRFGFCMNGALGPRKDPFAAIEAFRQLKEEFPIEFEPAELHLKTSIKTLHPGIEDLIPKLRIHYDIWPLEQLQRFYAAQHCLLAPSRGEGKNVPALEFQSTGGAVIATSWGGHKEWLHPDYNYGLDYTLAPAKPEYPTATWANASIDHLKEQMLHVFRNRAEAKQKGLLASQIIPEIASWDHVVQNLMLRLKAVPGGEELWQKAAFCKRKED